MDEQIQPVAKKTLQVPPKVLKTVGVVAGLAVAVAVLTSIVYVRPPTDGLVRRVTSVLPYPAAVVGSDVITIKGYLQERDALNTYFQSAAEQTDTVPTETEITKNIMETLIHKAVVEHLAKTSNVTLDDSRVDAFFADAVGGVDEAQFAEQLQTMFGWTPDEFRTRVVKPVVLAMQVGEAISGDADKQQERKDKADAAFARLEAGDDFTVVASDVSADFSANAGGDVGYVKMSDIPSEWKDAIAALDVGGHSAVIEGDESYMIFQVTDRTTAGEDTQVQLSLISIPKVSLEEAVQEYLNSVRVWKFIGRA